MISCFFYEPSLTEIILNKVWICFIISAVLYLLKYYKEKAKKIKIFLLSFFFSVLFSLISYALTINIIEPLLYEKSSLLYFLISFPLVLAPLGGAIFGWSRLKPFNKLQQIAIGAIWILYLFIFSINYRYYYKDDLIKTSSHKTFQKLLWNTNNMSFEKYKMLDDFHDKFMVKNKTTIKEVEDLLGNPDEIEIYNQVIQINDEYYNLKSLLDPDSINNLIDESLNKESGDYIEYKCYKYHLSKNPELFATDTITLKMDFVNDTLQLSYCNWKNWIYYY